VKEKKTKRSAVEQLQLIVLQLLDVEKSRLEIERETLAVKKIKLTTKGLVQDESGNCVQNISRKLPTSRQNQAN